MMPDASVLIPSYNGKTTLIPCMEHLVRQNHPPDRFEAVVVLDGSTDDSRQALEAITPPFKMKVVDQANRGRAAALNRAAAEADGKYLIVIDDDILAPPEFIDAHLRAHEQADVVIGPIPVSERSPKNYLTEGVRRWADAHAARMAGCAGKIKCTDIFGANISISRGNFAALGGYRAGLRRTEDFQLGKKILEAGLTVLFSPAAAAFQVYDKSFYSWCEDFYQDGRSQYALHQEFPDEKNNLKIGHYHPQTWAKSILRPLVIHNRFLGIVCLDLCKVALEQARKAGLRWKFLSNIQGLAGDLLYWKGVYDAIGDPRQFKKLIENR